MTTAPDLLASIVASTRRDLDIRRLRRSDADLHAQVAVMTRRPDGAGFAARLRRGDVVNVIAECKRRSPSKGVLKARYDPVAQASAYVRGGAAAISVLTEPSFFDGALGHLEAVRAAVDVPLLRKDFIVDDYQLLEAVVCGADAVLLIVSALEPEALVRLHRTAVGLGLSVLVEVHDETELDRAMTAGATIVGVNNRNLRTLDVDAGVSARLAARMPPGVAALHRARRRVRVAAPRRRRTGRSRHRTRRDPVARGRRSRAVPIPGAADSVGRAAGRRPGRPHHATRHDLAARRARPVAARRHGPRHRLDAGRGRGTS